MEAVNITSLGSMLPIKLFMAPQSISGQKSHNIRCASNREDNVVTLLDYGAGNVRSVRNAIRLLNFNIQDVKKPEDILEAKRLVFPGVGAFAAAMDILNKTGMAEALREYIKNDRPFLGICLGLQLLFEYSEENGPVKGLGVIPGAVGRFDSSTGLRVPHIGWNALQIQKSSAILEGVQGHHVYFVHSYRAMPSNDNNEWVSATCNYGGGFIAAVEKGNVHAVQFHPEKSSNVGLDILKGFLTGNRSDSVKSSDLAENQPLKHASTLAKRVIACLDVRANNKGDLVVTKGDQYDVREHSEEREVRNLGKPVELAGQYYKDGADEVTFLNITGFRDFPLGDLPMLEVLRRTSENVFVPLTIGGGIRDFTDKDGRYYSSLEVASEYFRSGADKISIGSDAVYAAEEYIKTGVKMGTTSLEQISYVYGNQAVVVSIDPRRVYLNSPKDVPFKTVELTHPGPKGEKYAWYQCTVNGGREGRPIGAYELAKAVEDLGAGEILLNCIDCDGQGQGFDIDLVKLISEAVNIPVIASSGAGAVEHFSAVFKQTSTSAALAAGIFHRREVPIMAVKEHLRIQGTEVRI
ncbi:imidazole glycerol phosphate synthase hisHF, chloroplastic isoform X1 [Cryptomeria japonica]|uniref:imidazole glycerol phosphate synthase hisHF, chloroplastic isoform X1 n=1 Tax=Cryptomeria japonica TaxID=3369 RepID=UPI0027D9F8A1|nr:imidazole glycerol phosphate synthase hisHF, chloroplastic isoform X1 [Cryptomeria japonica]XP_059074030.1 imidazole glycerol phosphate synthase hisHF, chloroplastic isoform X1 [Cryptomeria japonica]XP_059074031.1 imidazole glycerol phosphate synthase hisHF, chloroplastic isoform X1 [Cryptomeria japonica]XP_059074032.1 imidazole glycerol phosphate synthase hisHF, chloroplastic isoform X1 [Cryptomeria japonica]